MDLNFSLLPWQQEVYSDPTRFKVICAGRRCGKSRLSAVSILVEGLQAEPGADILYVAPTQGQASVIMWDLLLELGKDVIKSSHINSLRITLINGCRIFLRGADRPETLRGMSLKYLVLDEVADIPAEVFEKILRAALSDRKGKALFIGTPAGRNHFYDWFKLGQSGKNPEWKSWHFTTKDNPLIDPAEVQAAKETLSSFAFKQEYEASFDNAGTNLFKPEWMKYGPEPKEGSYVLAIDLAGFADVMKAAGTNKRLDESAIAIAKLLDDGSWWIKDIVHGRWDIKETAVKILKAIRDYQPIGVGIERGALKNAVLPYLSDLMRKNNIYHHIEDLTHGNKNKVDRVVWSLQGRMEHGRVTFNEDVDWTEFVDQMQMFPTAGVHDDLIDALSYVDQMAICTYQQDYEDDDWEPLDRVSGY